MLVEYKSDTPFEAPVAVTPTVPLPAVLKAGVAEIGAVNVSKIGGTAVAAGAGAVTAGTPRVTLASDDPAVARVGSLTETAPDTDTASSGLNGRLQRIAHRLTSLIGLYPTSLGQKTKTTSLAVTLASNEDLLTVTGAVTETAPATDTASSGLNGRLQRIAQRITSMLDALGTTADAAWASGNGTITSLLKTLAGAAISAAPVIVNHNPTAAGSLLLSSVVSAGSTNATSLKATAGQVYVASIKNVAAYPVYLKFYNKASAPTVGTDPVVWVLSCEATSTNRVEFPTGAYFSDGIAYSIVKDLTVAGPTAVVAADCVVNIGYV